MLVVDFADIERDALATAGGKAVNLGVMTRAGLPVPPGVVVATNAYRDVAASAGMERLLADLASTPATDVARLAVLAAECRAKLLASPIPDAIAQAIRAGYARLGASVPVAVRSSATAEDLPTASFAGQQDTYLNVVGPDAVLDATRRCWASLWTDRAVAYRATNRIDHHQVRLAVVIQRMVDSRVAGVLFTANPVTGRRRQAVIDASPGLGEAVVSGAVNPDHFVVDTASGAILERRLGDKRVVIRSVAGGGTEHVELASSADTACVTDDQVRALAALGDRVEAHYGTPQDTEWAFDADGTLWLTQARPITTLYPLPANAPKSSEDLRVYFCFSLAQGLQRPLTPMGLAVARVMGSAGSGVLGFPVKEPLGGPRRYADAGGRLFFDVTPVLRGAPGRAVFPRVLDVMEARSAVVLRQLFDDPRLSLTNRSWFSFIRRVMHIAASYSVPIVIARSLADPRWAHRRVLAVAAKLEARLAPAPGATAAQRLDFVENLLLHNSVQLLPRIMPGALAGFAMLGLAGRVLGRDATGDDLQTVLRALPDNVTTEMDLELWALSRRIAADPAGAEAIRDRTLDELAAAYHAVTLPHVAQEGLAEFLRARGQRAVAEIDVGMPRWSDDPRYVLGVLKNYLRLENRDAAPDQVFARRAAEAEAMVATLVERARRRGPLPAAIVRFALGRARALAGIRELPKYDIILVIAAVRRQLQIVGTELAAQGRLRGADDVFFVDFVEARAGLAGQDLRDLVVRRKSDYELELRRRHVPRVILSDGTEPEAEASTASGGKTDGALMGTPASAGLVTGIARVIEDPVGAHLVPGEILVAPSTDPGWTPLFLTAGGLVMEMGGANSHGAVVAREYGIPAVVGVPNATSRIKTGQRITVDGGAGRVVVEFGPALDATPASSDPVASPT